MIRLLVCLIVALLATYIRAAPEVLRSWRSADGTRTITAAFKKLDGDILTVATIDGKSISFALDKLDSASSARARELAAKNNPSQPSAFTAFDGFSFGSGIDATTRIVEKIPGVRSSLPPDLRGRTGINGIFSITLADIPLAYFFEFNSDESLVDVNLNGPAVTADALASITEQANKLSTLLTAQFGKPDLDVPPANSDSLGDGKSFFHQAWQARDNHIYLGTGKLDGKFCCVLRYSNKAPPPKPKEKSDD